MALSQSWLIKGVMINTHLTVFIQQGNAREASDSVLSYHLGAPDEKHLDATAI